MPWRLIVLFALAVPGAFPVPVLAQSVPPDVPRSVRYGYDASGRRVFEEVRTPLGTTVTRSPTPQYQEITHPDGTVERIVSIEVAGLPVATIRTVGTGTPEVFATHADHLRSTRLVTDASGAVAEKTDYDPFGKILSDQTIPSTLNPIPSFKELKKFTSHEFDSATNYTYAKARYLDTEAGRFISQDPAFWSTPKELLADPQQLNSYAYARNNPLRYIDPDGKLNIGIPGTWSTGNTDPAFIAFLSKAYATFSKLGGGTANYTYAVSLSDNKSSRAAAATAIANVIQNHQFEKGETLNIVGYSHGGNVAALLSQMIDRPIDNLVTLGTPVTGNYQFNESNIGTHINAYSNLDPVQVLGGGQLRGLSLLLGAGGLGACGLQCGVAGFLVGQQASGGEWGPAGRTFGNSSEVKDVDVTNQAKGWVLWTHSNLVQKPAVWAEVERNLGN